MTSTVRPHPDEHRWLDAALPRRFELNRLLGRGAMGTVYLALDRLLQRWVAIKALLPEFSDDTERRAQFRREAQANARLQHHNIVAIYDFGETDGTAFSVMRFVNGESLAVPLARGVAMQPAEAVRILVDVALALDYAHRLHIVHRDIKPENVLIDRDSRTPYLTDFGIARTVSLDALPMSQRAAERGMVRGSPHFMSPEQAAGEIDLDGRSDIYGLGVLGFSLLTGTLPFTGSWRDVLVAHAQAPVPTMRSLAPAVSPALERVIRRCLAKEAKDRWPSGRVLATALRESVNAPTGMWTSFRRIVGLGETG